MGEPRASRRRSARTSASRAHRPSRSASTSLMRELERTGAFDRAWLMIASPTGTGYVNYAAVSILEFLTRGDCATVAMQYSARPSPLSLDRVERRPPAHAACCCAAICASGSRQCPPERAAEGRAVRREPRRVDEPGRVRRPGHAGPRRARHRPRDLDRHAALQQVEGARAVRRPPRRRPRARRRVQRHRRVGRARPRGARAASAS